MSDTMTAGIRSGEYALAGHFCSSRTLRSLFDRSGMCMAGLDTTLRLIEVNADFTRQFERSRAELDGRRFCDLLHEDYRGQVSRQLTYLLADQFPRFTEPDVTFRQSGAAAFSGELTAIGVNGDGGKVDNLVVLVRPEKGADKCRPAADRKLQLSDMDARILEGVAAGVPTLKLASMLYLSRGGVEYHLNVLMRRLKIKNRPALVSKGLLAGPAVPGLAATGSPGLRQELTRPGRRTRDIAWLVSTDLEGLAGVAAAQGQAELAARTFRATDALRAASGTPVRSMLRERHDRDVAAARAELGPERFSQAYAHGQAMPADQVITEALRGLTFA